MRTKFHSIYKLIAVCTFDPDSYHYFTALLLIAFKFYFYSPGNLALIGFDANSNLRVNAVNTFDW